MSIQQVPTKYHGRKLFKRDGAFWKTECSQVRALHFQNASQVLRVCKHSSKYTRNVSYIGILNEVSFGYRQFARCPASDIF